MASKPSDRSADTGGAAAAPMPVKIVVAGGFAVGKTTFVGLDLRDRAADDRGGDDQGRPRRRQRRRSTTDQDDHHGRHGLRSHHASGTDLVLYLFGTPGPGPVLVHVGRPGAGRDRRRRARRHPPARGVLPGRRLLRGAPGCPFVVGSTASRARSATTPARSARRWRSPATRRCCSATHANARRPRWSSSSWCSTRWHGRRLPSEPTHSGAVSMASLSQNERRLVMWPLSSKTMWSTM